MVTLLTISLLSTSINLPNHKENCHNLSKLKTGHYKLIKSNKAQGANYFVYHRTMKEIKQLKKSKYKSENNNNSVHQSWPSYMPATQSKWASKGLRSLSENYFVSWAPTPNLVCSPLPLAFDEIKKRALWKEGQGGLWDVCYNIGYDYTGRPTFIPDYIETYPNGKLAKIRSKFNLVIPKHSISNNDICFN